MTDMKERLVPASNGRKESSVLSLDNLGYGTTDCLHAGSVLSAHGVGYKVKVTSRLFRGHTEKEILSGITGVFKPGLTAIMGPTGAGKSTLMDILAARKGSWGISGHVLLDGKQLPANYRCMVGYVVQDDVIMGTLTVRENLHFSAALRLPTSVRTAERNERVENVIKELGLTKCADTKVGTDFIRGVSGGERKRCNVGMELVTSPTVLFLDEPTTGLDADTAYKVVSILKRLSKKGRTIVFTIHQPRYSIFTLFDQLLLLSEGFMVYSGPSSDALEFFVSQGFSCPMYNNPPDFFMDVINGNYEEASDKTISNKQGDIINSYHDKLMTGFRNSSWYYKLQAEAGDIMSRFQAVSELNGSEPDRVKYATTFINQISIIAGRSMKNSLRNPVCTALSLIVSIAFAVVTDAIFWQLKDDPPSSLKDRDGVLLFLVVSQLFLNMTAIDTLSDERRLFTHEHISGFYRASAYFVVKIVFDILPMRIIPVLMTSFMVYFAVGLNSGFDHFLNLTLTLVCVTLAAAALCFLFSSLWAGYTARTLVLFAYIMMFLFGGFVVNFSTMSAAFRWLQYLSLFKFSLCALYINEFKDRTFCTANETFCKTGEQHLLEQEIEYTEPWDYWKNHVALIVIAFVLLMLTYYVLRRSKGH